MNLARQIAKDLEDAGCLMLVTSASIIAAKLEPVRDAIRMHIDGDCGETKGLRQALAMFEEEE